jgi:ATP-dependent Clp protease adaptor protein ClpS
LLLDAVGFADPPFSGLLPPPQDATIVMVRARMKNSFRRLDISGYLRSVRHHKGVRVTLANMSSQSAAVLPEIDNSTDSKVQPLYHVILLNDEDHTYDYVVEMLVKIFQNVRRRSFQPRVEVDTKGTTILLTCELSKAELKRDQIHVMARTGGCRGRWIHAAVVEPAG